MNLLIRSMLFTILQIVGLALFLPAPGSNLPIPTTFLVVPTYTVWLGLVALMGIVSNELTYLLMPVKTRWAKRILQNLVLALIAVGGLFAFGGASWPAPEIGFSTDLSISWPFIVLEILYFVGYLVVYLLIDPEYQGRAGSIATGGGKQDRLRLQQLWLAKPLALFQLSSLEATNECLTVTIPTVSHVKTQNIAYTNIGNIRIEGWRLPTCTVYIDSIEGDIHVELDKMPTQQARRFARIVLGKVDLVQTGANPDPAYQQPGLSANAKGEPASSNIRDIGSENAEEEKHRYKRFTGR